MADYSEFTKLPIFKDIQNIIKKAKKPVTNSYESILHTTKKDIRVFKIISIDTIRNYSENISDEIHVVIYLPLNQYAKDIYPYADNLEMTLNITEYPMSPYAEETTKDTYTERFKAILKDKLNANTVNLGIEKYSEKDLGVAGFIEVRLQLVTRVLEPLRIKQVSGSFSNVLPKDFIESILYTEANKIKVDGKPLLPGVNIVTPNNIEKQNNLVFPSGTNLIDIPDLCQNELFGLYGTGLGSYIQKYNDVYTWFVYPLYDHTRFDKCKDKKIIFYATDKSILPGSEVTYREEGDVTYIIVTGKTKYHNPLENNYMDSGVGFRLPHAKSFMRKPVVLTTDGVEAKKSKLSHDVIVKQRNDNLNYAPRGKDYISSNPYKAYSEIAKKNIAQITLEWNHAKYDTIYPGMPCKYTYVDNSEVKNLTGTILHTHTLISLQGNPTSSNVYNINTGITIAVDRETNNFKREDDAI